MRVVDVDAGIAELDAGLHHEGDDAAEGLAETVATEGRLVHRERVLGCLRRRHDQMVRGVRRAAGHRNLGPDDVDGRSMPRARGRGLGSRGEAGGACRDDVVVQHGRVVGAAHAGVEMDLGVAGGGEIGHQDLGLRHRGVGGQSRPGIGAEMIAAEDEGCGVEPALGREVADEVAEAGGRHPGIAAVLVHLVAGRFDQHRRAAPARMAQGGLEHHRMGGTDGGKAAAPARRARHGETAKQGGAHGATREWRGRRRLRLRPVTVVPPGAPGRLRGHRSFSTRG